MGLFNHSNKEEQKQLKIIGKEFKHNKQIFMIQNMYFDDNKQQLFIEKTPLPLTSKNQLINYKDIVGYKPTIDGQDVHKHHGVARAITGGALLGGVGAIVGATTGGKNYSEINDMNITIFFKDNSNYSKNLLVLGPVKKGTLSYKGFKDDLDSLCNKLQIIIDKNGIKDDDTNLSQLVELKKLLDDGVITQSDFDTKKKQLLGL